MLQAVFIHIFYLICNLVLSNKLTYSSDEWKYRGPIWYNIMHLFFKEQTKHVCGKITIVYNEMETG